MFLSFFFILGLTHKTISYGCRILSNFLLYHIGPLALFWFPIEYDKKKKILKENVVDIHLSSSEMNLQQKIHLIFGKNHITRREHTVAIWTKNWQFLFLFSFKQFSVILIFQWTFCAKKTQESDETKSLLYRPALLSEPFTKGFLWLMLFHPPAAGTSYSHHWMQTSKFLINVINLFISLPLSFKYT